jgi:O-antigen/teichoic acid export membrane protein
LIHVTCFKIHDMRTSIAKNTAFMTLASIGQKLVAFVYFTLIARQIGADGTGKYFIALAFTTVFVVFVDMGFSNVLVREAAKAKEKMQQYFSTVLSIKVLFGVLTYLAVILAINLLGYSLEIRHLVYLSAVTMLFDSLHLTIYGILRAIGELKWEAIGILGSQTLTLIMGTFFLYTGRPLIFLILAFTIPSFLNVCYAAIVLRRKYRITLKPEFDRQVFKYLGRIAIPFALAAIFARVYGYVDSILLSKLVGNEAVGWYSIAHKITYAFQFIPLALIAVLYPRFSEYFERDKKKLAYIFERGLKYLLLIAFPIAVGIGVLAQDIVFYLYTPEYANSVLPLQVLMSSLVFSFVSFPIGAFLNACNKQVTQTVIVAIVMIVNVALNLVLIPRYGLVGAAVAALVGSIMLSKLGYWVVPKITRISHAFITKTILQLILSSSLMGLAVWFVNSQVHFIFAVLTGVAIYPLMLFLTRAVTKENMREAYILIKK